MLRLIRSVLLIAVVFGASRVASAQALSSLDRDRGKAMLRQVHQDLKDRSYDPTFRGIDLNARVKQAEARIDTARSNGEVFGIIAQMLSEFDDSHLFFIPPARAARVQYGWEMIPVGDSVFVQAVKPGSDADKKGLRAGDLVLTVNGFQPTRDNWWKLHYLYWFLRPQPFLRVTARDPSGQTRSLELNADIHNEQKLYNINNDEDVHRLILQSQSGFELLEPRWRQLGDVLLWQLNEFWEQGRDLTAPMRAAKDAKAIVLDLRGNGGGLVGSLVDLVGAFVDKRVLVAVTSGRDGVDSVWANPSRSPFKGRLVVLIDGRSASASEMFARIMQLEGRAVVVGDRSMGAVLQSRGYSRGIGTGRVVPYGMSITTESVHMSNGESLEHRGVTPDEIVLPTAADLAAGRDPALAFAVDLAGGIIDPKLAGSVFPLVWVK